MAEFRQQLRTAKHILVLTGAGISAESGVPTFRGAGGFWRRYESTSLATPSAFARDPSLVWQFYHYRRELVRACTPNPAHRALVEFERYCQSNGNHGRNVCARTLV
jgi:NAD-dependent deacetylase sirtuin 5